MNEHPLYLVIKQYIDDFHAFKRDNEDLDNMRFNMDYGFSIRPPKTWPVYDIIGDLVSYLYDHKIRNISFVYSSTEVYKKIYVPVESNVNFQNMSISYFSWHEMYSAMSRASSDVTHIKRLKDYIQQADVVFFIGADGAMDEVIDQINGLSIGCLIIIY